MRTHPFCYRIGMVRMGKSATSEDNITLLVRQKRLCRTYF